MYLTKSRDVYYIWLGQGVGLFFDSIGDDLSGWGSGWCYIRDEFYPGIQTSEEVILK